MEENKEAPAMEKSSEQPDQQQDSLQSRNVGEDQQHLQDQASPPRHQQSGNSQSPKTSSPMSESNHVLRTLLNSPTKITAEQAYVASNKDPCSAKQTDQSSSSQLLQGEKRRSEGVSEQHLQSKQLRQPDDPTEEQKIQEEKGETEESDKETAKE